MEPPNHAAWDTETFVSRLRMLGMTRYHHLHPFHRVMNAGGLTAPQIRGWVANRYYYQKSIPVKDAAILSNCPHREVRRMWIGRLRDHDGVQGDEGGIEAWLRLARAVGLTPEETQDERHVLPGVRFAVDAYVAFARNRPWPIAVASSLTELFAPDLMSQRLAAFERFYSWVPSEGLDYFRKRLTQAPADSSGALELTTRYCTTRELQEEAIRGLSFKCDILWSMLDTIVLAYGAGHPGERGAQSSSPSPGAPQLREPEIDPSPSQPSPWSEGARPQLTKKARFKPDPVTGQATLLYPEGVLVLNPTGEAIVRLCDGKNTVDQIVAELASRYKTAPNMIAPDVAEYLDRLTERRLIEGPGTSLEDIS